MNRKPPNHADMVAWLAGGQASLGPVALRPVPPDVVRSSAPTADLLLDAVWQGRSARYAVEVKSLGTPKALQAAMLQARHLADALGLPPMVAVPYLSGESLAWLARQDTSGVDLCGNGVLLSPNMHAWEAGHPNTVRGPAKVRNPYDGDTSIFVRTFLIEQQHDSLKSLQRMASGLTLLRQGDEGALRLSTASKAVSALAEDLIVARDGQSMRLVDPARLLRNLSERYQQREASAVVGRTNLSRDQVWARLAVARLETDLRYAATGLASAAYHGALTGVERLSLYCDDVHMAAEAIELKPGRAFANVELVQAVRNLHYFDVQHDGDALWASAIQTWLELSRAGARAEEAGAEMGKRLLDRCRRSGNG